MVEVGIPECSSWSASAARIDLLSASLVLVLLCAAAVIGDPHHHRAWKKEDETPGLVPDSSVIRD